ncbi:MAG: serine/threonine protein kinase, partial [Thermoleophilaceae bacterium]|nr:serine/threonine protein kinase [Thermoleophilaceae bacterium]
MERTLNLPSEPLPAGEGDVVLDRYRLVHRLGQGGFGVVWLAEDERLQRDVALKVIAHGDDPGASRGAEREALAAARLNHPGIVALYEFGADGGAAYLVSELVKGRTFGELHRAGALSDRDVARIGSALCDALSHAHAHGVVHRDVKPANVIVVSEPAAGAGFAKLADFGVAHLASADPVTQTGDVVGTLAYMAPEQAEGHRVSAAADVYSLALTLYEGWTGTNPVRARTPAATARRMGKRLLALERARPDLPAELCLGIDAALDPAPDLRPAPEELRDTLAAAEAGLSDDGGLVEPETIDRMGLERADRA